MKKIKPSEITSTTTYLKRRSFIKGGLVALVLTASKKVLGFHENKKGNFDKILNDKDKLNSLEQITTYNNYYEFGSKHLLLLLFFFYTIQQNELL